MVWYATFDLRWLRCECTSHMVSLPIHHFESKQSKDLEKNGTTKWKESGSHESHGRCPIRNTHVNGQWCRWTINFYFNKPLKFGLLTIRIASITLTNILSYRWSMLTDWEKSRFRNRGRRTESQIGAAGGRRMPGGNDDWQCVQPCWWKTYSSCHEETVMSSYWTVASEETVQSYWTRGTGIV